MDEPEQSPLVSSAAAAPPRFQYQFVREPETGGRGDGAEEDEDEEDEDEDEDFDEQLEVMERRPLPAAAAAPPAPAPQRLELGGGEQPPRPAAPEPPPRPGSPAGLGSSSSSSAASTPSPEPARPAPLPPAPRRRGLSSAAADETLFALPAASEPLIYSSAEKVMDLQEKPGSIVSSGQEDFTAVPLDTAASLPSFSPFSADPFKEHATFDMLSEGLSARTIYKEKGSDIYKETTENTRNPFLIEKNLREAPEMEYSEMKSPSTKVEATIVSQTKEEMLLENGKEIYSLGKITAQQQDASPEAHMELFEKHDEKESSKKAKYDIDDGGEKMALKEDTPSREQYVDFKPYEPIWEVKDTCHGVSSLKEAVISEVDRKLESSLDKRFDADKMLTIQKDYEKESEGSNEDLSFPSTPEALKGSSQTYITCAKFEPTITSEDNIVKSLSLLEDGASENKTDEKKIAEMKVQTWIERDFKLVGRQEGLEADYAKTDTLSNISFDNAANVPEGLTPDLVQEAYESEMHDATCTKLTYETKIDLVQTSESLQEPLNPVAQLCPSFEGPEAAPSPVLPDIVMEAPSNTGAASADAIAVQLEASPLETFTSVASYDNVKQVSEKPPLYQEELNISLKEAQGIKEEAAFKEPDHKNRAVTEEIETPYISIACDLIKETKISSESPSPIFSDYSETLIAECVSQDVPEHKEPVEKLSPQPENDDVLSNQPTPDFPQKENEVPSSLTATSKSVENTGKIGTDHGSMEELEELLPSTAKPYLESFQPELAFSRMPALVPVEAASMEIDKKEKISLQMEDLNAVAYSAEMHIAEESKIGDKVLLPTESSPVQVTEDFVTLVTTESTPKLVTEVFGKEILYKDESKEMTNGIKGELRQLPCPELPHDLSLKNVKVKAEENVHVLEKPSEAVNREELEISKASLLPADVSSLSAEKEVVSIVKPEALEKEVEREVPSGKEKEKTPAIFSAKLSKSSVVDLLYWRDIKKTGVVFGASLFLLLSLTVFSIVSVTAYIALALLSVTISFRIYKGVIHAIQKSDEGHPFRAYLESDVAVSEELVQKYSNVVLGHVNGTVKELRRLFLVDDLVDSLKFAVLMWVFTYVGALFNGLTLLILALISLFSVPVIYERHQAQIDHYLGLVNKNVKDAMAKIQAKIPGLKRKTE